MPRKKKNPFPRVPTNLMSLVETLEAETDKSKKVHIHVPFFKFEGTVGEFQGRTSEFRSAMLDYLRKTYPERNWQK